MQSTNIWAVYNNKEINSDKRTNTNYWKGKILKSDRKRINAIHVINGTKNFFTAGVKCHLKYWQVTVAPGA